MKFDRFMALMIVLIWLSMAYAIFSTASAHVIYEPRLPTWDKPDIEQCGKELWERIKEGCDE